MRAAGNSQGTLLVANKTDRTLGIIDLEAGKQVAALAEDGVTGHEVAASRDGRFAYVPIFGSGGVGGAGTDGQLIRVFDLEKRQLVSTFDFGKGVRPHCVVVGPKDGLLYVTTELDESISVIDPQALKLVRRISTGQPESHMLAITRDGRRGYVSNVGPGTVSVLDLEKGSLLKVIQVCSKAQRISLSADDRYVFTADQTKPQLAVIDTESNEIRKWVPLPGTAYGTAATPDGRYLVAALIGQRKVGIVDLETFAVSRTLDVPKAPQEVLVRPDGAFAYVSCDASAQVAEIDLKEMKVNRLISAGAGADGLAWAPR
jgi:DNA-binding beta-propeller fold protein YncE